MLTIERLSKSYGTANILRGLDMHIPRGECVGLLGPNGVGKTTLIGCVCGTVRPDCGEMRLEGVSIHDHPEQTKHRIGTCFQETIVDRFFRTDASVRFHARYNGLARAPATQRTAIILAEVGLHAKQHSRPETLSGGMQRRLQLARALVHDPDLIFLDEPTAGIDLDLKETLYTMIRRLHREQGKTIILTSHNLEEVATLCTRALFLSQGVIACDLPIPNTTTAAQVLHQTYRTVFPAAGADL
ncbi:MAG: ABC transporter ATP-binding protein [Deltaproteobacteria bacterium]|nr:ABC transporter ATP-binding protein [Deltaproteobacteria bacterium]